MKPLDYLSLPQSPKINFHLLDKPCPFSLFQYQIYEDQFWDIRGEYQWCSLSWLEVILWDILYYLLPTTSQENPLDYFTLLTPVEDIAIVLSLVYNVNILQFPVGTARSDFVIILQHYQGLVAQ